MSPALKCAALVYGLAAAVVISGCHQARTDAARPVTRRRQGDQIGHVTGAARPVKRRRQGDQIRHVLCLYDQKPWLNIDTAGDRDPEGIQFRVFLLPDAGRGVLRDGTLHIDMYQIDRKGPDQIERTLASDWHYPTSAFQPVNAKILGMGYHLRLRWGKKGIPGHEIELITQFEDRDGNIMRSGTKRLRVPKYAS